MISKSIKGAIIFLIFYSFETTAQDINKLTFKDIEDSLSVLTKRILQEDSNTSKVEINNLFLTLFRSALERNGSLEYPFDSLKHIGKLVSKDGRFRVFTWDLQQSVGNFEYFGLIQIKKDKNRSSIYELVDNHKKVNDPINDILSIQNWMGAIYYTMIEQKYDGKKYYILLGFDFNSIFTSKKIIEVLTFDADQKPVFGSKIFRVGNDYLSRIVFEFSARTTLMLRYNAETEMIIFDHLSPSRPDFEGNYQFYGPDFTYDGFKFEKGIWVYVQDLDLRNPKRDKVKLIDTVQKLPEPGFLYKSKGEVPMQIVK